MKFDTDSIRHKKRNVYIVMVLLLLSIIGLSLYTYLSRTYTLVYDAPLSLADLPQHAIFVPHPEDVKKAEELDKIPMKHYGTLEDIEKGGPIYGTYGYGIVSIEYEIPLDDVGIRMVGSESSGKLLAIPEILKIGKTIPYDHFHVGISQHSHHGGHGEEADDHDDDSDERIIIHFMLISHEREEAVGLYCG